ncbi:MAG: hypothetical protein ACR2RF_06315 [Geminicoccaceae bacterium]
MTPTIPKRKSPMRGEYLHEITSAAATMTDQFFGVPWDQACGPSRKTEESRARRWAAWWMHGQGLSLREIGRAMGRDAKAVCQMLDRARWEHSLGRMNTARITEIAQADRALTHSGCVDVGAMFRTIDPPPQDAVSRSHVASPAAEEQS